VPRPARTVDVDGVARLFACAGRIGRSMPSRLWTRAGISYPLVAESGVRLGTVVPGVGLVLDVDAQRIGLRRRPRHVHDRTPWMRRLERAVRDEAAAITSAASMLAAYANTANTGCVVTGDLGNVANDVPQGNPWQQDFDRGGAISTFTSAPGSAPDRTTAGAYNYWMQEVTGLTKYVVAISYGLQGATGNFGWDMLVIVDALVQVTVPCNVTTVQTVNSAALTRYTSGVGVYASWWAYGPVGAGGAVEFATQSTITVTYTNQSGVAGQSTSFLSNGNIAPLSLNDETTLSSNSYPQMPLVAGDYGVREVQTFQTSVADTSGDTEATGLLLFYPLIFVASLNDLGISLERDALSEPAMLVELVASTGTGLVGCLTSINLSSNNAGSGTTVNPITLTTVDG
jgi:hypothetical protein